MLRGRRGIARSMLSPAFMMLPVLMVLAAARVGSSAEKDVVTATSTVVDEMVTWLEQGGADLSAVKVGTGVHGERGVIAARDVFPGETILRGMQHCPAQLW